MLCVDTRNEVNIGLTKSVNSIIPVVKISPFLYARLWVETLRGNKQWREKERARDKEEKSERQCTALKG